MLVLGDEGSGCEVEMTYITPDDSRHAAGLEGGDVMVDGADDGQACEYANHGPEDHGQVAQRAVLGMGAVPEEVRHKRGQPGQGGRREVGVELPINVEVPPGRTRRRRGRVCYHGGGRECRRCW